MELIRRARCLAHWEDIFILIRETETLEGEYGLHRLAIDRMHQEEAREERKREKAMEAMKWY